MNGIASEADNGDKVSLISIVEKWNRTLVLSFAVVLMAGFGALDYLTGYELAFSFFYLLPISLLAWKGGRWLGIAGSAVGAAVSAAADVAAGKVYSSAFIMYWNCGTRFLELLRTEIERVRRYRRPLTLAYLDLDNFKTINDTFGHAAGDAALRDFVSAVRSHIRSSDTIARLGGDEFALLIPEADRNAAEIVLAKIRSEILRTMDSQGRVLTVSVGSLTCLDDSIEADELVRKADDLMYEAKVRGKNATTFASIP